MKGNSHYIKTTKTEDLVIVTEEILNVKLHFLCNEFEEIEGCTNCIKILPSRQMLPRLLVASYLDQSHQ